MMSDINQQLDLLSSSFLLFPSVLCGMEHAVDLDSRNLRPTAVLVVRRREHIHCTVLCKAAVVVAGTAFVPQAKVKLHPRNERIRLCHSAISLPNS